MYLEVDFRGNPDWVSVVRIGCSSGFFVSLAVVSLPLGAVTRTGMSISRSALPKSLKSSISFI